MASKIKVILDTNMLMAIGKFKVDVFENISNELGEVKFYITKSVEKELENLAKESSTLQKQAKIAVEMMFFNKVEILDEDSRIADKDLLNLADEGYIIATNDKELKMKLRELNKKFLYLRQKKFIERSWE